MAPTRARVVVNHGGTAVGSNVMGEPFEVEMGKDDTVAEVKRRIVACPEAKNVPAEKLLLSFGPSPKPIGAEYEGDPNVDEEKMKMGDLSVLGWLERFPHWPLYVKFLPPTPPAPGEAAVRAAAIAEDRNPEEMLQEARAKGEVAKLSDLPAPWGSAPEGKGLLSGDAHEEVLAPGQRKGPALYPEASKPATDAVKTDAAGWTPAETPKREPAVKADPEEAG